MVGLRAKRPHFTEKWLRFTLHLVAHFYSARNKALSVIAGKATMRTYERGEFIHRAGDPSDKLFIVHKGTVKVYRLSDSGKEQLMRILNPGDFAGELALFSATAHDSYAERSEERRVGKEGRERWAWSDR